MREIEREKVTWTRECKSERERKGMRHSERLRGELFFSMEFFYFKTSLQYTVCNLGRIRVSINYTFDMLKSNIWLLFAKRYTKFDLYFMDYEKFFLCSQYSRSRVSLIYIRYIKTLFWYDHATFINPPAHVWCRHFRMTSYLTNLSASVRDRNRGSQPFSTLILIRNFRFYIVLFLKCKKNSSIILQSR